MIAEMNEPMLSSVVLLPALPSWTPRPMELPPPALATIGLMMLVVKEAIRVLNASAITSPTATMMTSPRMRKFLNPVSMLRTSLAVPAGSGR